MRALWTPRWLLVHVPRLVLVVGFLLLGWWQVTRAVNGNLLSFGYAVEWPAFAAFVVVRVGEGGPPGKQGGPGRRGAFDHCRGKIRRSRSVPGRDANGCATTPRTTTAVDSELAAYNRYLAWAERDPHASPSEYTVEPRGGNLMSAALLRFRVVAYVVGVFLLVLVFVAVPLKYLADQPALAAVVGTLHGFLYMVYLVVAF